MKMIIEEKWIDKEKDIGIVKKASSLPHPR